MESLIQYVQSAPKKLPNFEALQLSYFFSKNETKIPQESVFTLQSRRVNFFHRCQIFYAQWLHFSDVTNCITFYEHGAVNGTRLVFDKMFESGKRVVCFPSDA